MSHWPVLIVDDEPDVLKISELAMKNFTVYGLPLKIYTAESKAEAVHLQNSTFAMQGQLSPLAIAIIDVVMESDSAGLELCDSIRYSQHNHMTQLFIRTGQPGTAPEREVIDRYDINGYFSKTEVTEDKLYSLVKSGVRQFYLVSLSFVIAEFTNRLIEMSGSRTSLKKIIVGMWADSEAEGDGLGTEVFKQSSYVFINGEGVGGNLDEAEAIRERLNNLPGAPLGPAGDRYYSDENHDQVIKIGGGAEQAEVHHVIKGQFNIPDVALMTLHAFWSSFARLWHPTS